MRLLSWLFWAAATVVPVITTEEKDLSRAKRESSEKRIVCYYTNWSVYRPGTAKFSPQNINPYLCTHLIYAFGGLSKDNALKPFDKYQDIEQGGYAKFNGLKTYNKNLKTMVAIGGWNEGSARFSPLVADSERRREFVKNTIRFLRQNHFDGLDLDWEYPSFRDGGKPRDRDNYATLVQEFREEFDRESQKTGRPRLLLTMAVPAGVEYVDKGYDVVKLNKYLDWMNVLSYDYHSAFEPTVNHHSPLYSLEEDDEYNFDAQLNIDHTIKHYIKLGADRNKLVLGIPTYGRSYTLFNPDATELGAPADGPGEQGEATREKGYLAYYEICERIKSGGWTVENNNPGIMGPYSYKGNQWVGYDDESIVRAKAKYVNENDLGGIMFWSIDNDDFRGKCHGKPYPLIEAAKEALLADANELVPAKTSQPRNRNKTGGKKENEEGTSVRRKSRLKGKSSTTTELARTKSIKSTTTPQPPTTPDPGSDFTCKDEGFFPHPRDCKKYFWCLDSGPSSLGIVAHQFTCPSGLVFNKISDSCDYARNVICKNKESETTTTPSTTTTTTTSTTTTARPTTARSRIITASQLRTTTTTTEAPEEYEEYEQNDEEEDPGTIKELINLIKKLGGVEQLEKQLNLQSAEEKEKIKPSLYSKVLQGRTGNKYRGVTQESSTSRYVTLFRNRPNAPQSPGKEVTEQDSRKAEKPRYITLERNRSRLAPLDQSSDDDEEEEIEESRDEKEQNKRDRKLGDNKYIFDGRRKRPNSDSTTEKEYVTLKRSRPIKEETTTQRYKNILRTRSTTQATVEEFEEEDDEIEDDNEEDAVEDHNDGEEEVIKEEKEPVQKQKKYSSIIRDNKRIVTEVDDSKVSRERVPLYQTERSTSDANRTFEETFAVHNVNKVGTPKYVHIRRGEQTTQIAGLINDVNTVNSSFESSKLLKKDEKISDSFKDEKLLIKNGAGNESPDTQSIKRPNRLQFNYLEVTLNNESATSKEAKFGITERETISKSESSTEASFSKLPKRFRFSPGQRSAIAKSKEGNPNEDDSSASDIFTIILPDPSTPTTAENDIFEDKFILTVSPNPKPVTQPTTIQNKFSSFADNDLFLKIKTQPEEIPLIDKAITSTSTETTVVTSIAESSFTERLKISVTKRPRQKVKDKAIATKKPSETTTEAQVSQFPKRYRATTRSPVESNTTTITTTTQGRGFRFRIKPTFLTEIETTSERRFIPKRDRNYKKFVPPAKNDKDEEVEEQKEENTARFQPSRVRIPARGNTQSRNSVFLRPRRPIFPSRRAKEDLETEQSGSFFGDRDFENEDEKNEDAFAKEVPKRNKFIFNLGKKPKTVDTRVETQNLDDGEDENEKEEQFGKEEENASEAEDEEEESHKFPFGLKNKLVTSSGDVSSGNFDVKGNGAPTSVQPIRDASLRVRARQQFEINLEPNYNLRLRSQIKDTELAGVPQESKDINKRLTTPAKLKFNERNQNVESRGNINVRPDLTEETKKEADEEVPGNSTEKAEGNFGNKFAPAKTRKVNSIHKRRQNLRNQTKEFPSPNETNKSNFTTVELNVNKSERGSRREGAFQEGSVIRNSTEYPASSDTQIPDRVNQPQQSVILLNNSSLSTNRSNLVEEKLVSNLNITSVRDSSATSKPLRQTTIILNARSQNRPASNVSKEAETREEKVLLNVAEKSNFSDTSSDGKTGTVVEGDGNQDGERNSSVDSNVASRALPKKTDQRRPTIRKRLRTRVRNDTGNGEIQKNDVKPSINVDEVDLEVAKKASELEGNVGKNETNNFGEGLANVATVVKSKKVLKSRVRVKPQVNATALNFSTNKFTEAKEDTHKSEDLSGSEGDEFSNEIIESIDIGKVKNRTRILLRKRVNNINSEAKTVSLEENEKETFEEIIRDSTWNRNTNRTYNILDNSESSSEKLNKTRIVFKKVARPGSKNNDTEGNEIHESPTPAEDHLNATLNKVIKEGSDLQNPQGANRESRPQEEETKQSGSVKPSQTIEDHKASALYTNSETFRVRNRQSNVGSSDAETQESLTKGSRSENVGFNRTRVLQRKRIRQRPEDVTGNTTEAHIAVTEQAAGVSSVTFRNLPLSNSLNEVEPGGGQNENSPESYKSRPPLGKPSNKPGPQIPKQDSDLDKTYEEVDRGNRSRVLLRKRVRNRQRLNNEGDDQMEAEAGRVVPSPFNSFFGPNTSYKNKGEGDREVLLNNSSSSVDSIKESYGSEVTTKEASVKAEGDGTDPPILWESSKADATNFRGNSQRNYTKIIKNLNGITKFNSGTPFRKRVTQEPEGKEDDREGSEVPSSTITTRTGGSPFRRVNQDFTAKRRNKVSTTTTQETPIVSETPRRRTTLTDRRRFRPELRTVQPKHEEETEVSVTSTVRPASFTRRRIRPKTKVATTTTTTTTTEAYNQEDSKLEESKDSSNIPDLADPAVVAIHNLATISPVPVPISTSLRPASITPAIGEISSVRFATATPSPYTLEYSPVTVTPSSFSSPSKIPIGLFPRPPSSIRPFIASEPENPLTKLSSPVPLRTTAIRVKPPLYATENAFILDNPVPSTQPRRTTQSPKVLPPPVVVNEAESKPRKPKPFTKIQKRPAAVIETEDETQPYDYQVYDDVDEDPLANVPPSALKVKVHSDGYIECLDRGNFPHPFSCKKFISCAKMENNELLGWEYTCPKHLSFDPVGGICNWSAGLGCQH